MADQYEDRKLDELLDSALSEYSAVEPRPGLETRILARVRDSAEPSWWWRVRWVVAGVVATAVAVLALSVLSLRPARRLQPVQVHEEPPATVQPQPDSKVTTAKTAPIRRERPQHRAKPQQELAQRDRPSVFPTPTGLSEQEKLMMAYLAQTPKEEVIAQLRAPDPKEEEEFWKDIQAAVARPQR